MHRSRFEIENKELDFEFEIVNVQFNELGRYALRLTVENPLLEGSGAGVRLWVNNGDVLCSNTGTTDIVTQANINDICSVHKKKFIFRLPKGYCQNDKNHDVRLRIEAFRVTGSSLTSGKKAGEAFFAIYPRTNAPRINVFAKDNEDFYSYSNIMVLLRAQDDTLSMHCGRMAYGVSFHEVRPPKDVPRRDSPPLASKDRGGSPLIAPSSPPLLPAPTLERPPPSAALPQRRSPTPASHSPTPQPRLQNEPSEGTNPEPSPEPPEGSLPPSPVQGRPFHQRKPSTSSFRLSLPEHTPVRTPEALPHVRVTETPPGKADPRLTCPTNDWPVSRPGKEAVSIILHGATDLAALSDGSVPQPFVTAKSGSDGEKGQAAQGVTHATIQATHSPSWEEKVTVEIDEENAKDEVVILSIADSRTKELLASYRVPVAYLQIFHHYHVELIQPHPSVPSGVRLYVSVVRKGSAIPWQEGFAFTGFEVLLRAVEKPLKDPVGPLLAVARIVPDYESYKDTMLMKTPRLAGVNVTTIKCPTLHQSCFDVLHCTSQGHPQVSHAGYPQEQPVWNSFFLFQGRDCATIFTAGAALVLEYYPITTVMNSVSWYIRSPLGFSMVPLDQNVYHKLMAESGGHGLRLDGLPVQGNSLRTTSNTNPTVGLVLRLIRSEQDFKCVNQNRVQFENNYEGKEIFKENFTRTPRTIHLWTLISESVGDSMTGIWCKQRPDSSLAATDPQHLPTLDSKPAGTSLNLKQEQATNAALSTVNPAISSGLRLSDLEELIHSPTQAGTVELPPAPCVKVPGGVPDQRGPTSKSPRLSNINNAGSHVGIVREKISLYVGLPSYDALAQILPEYDYLFRGADPKERPEREKKPPVRAPNLLQTQQTAALPHKRLEFLFSHFPACVDHVVWQTINLFCGRCLLKGSPVCRRMSHPKAGNKEVFDFLFAGISCLSFVSLKVWKIFSGVSEAPKIHTRAKYCGGCKLKLKTEHAADLSGSGSVCGERETELTFQVGDPSSELEKFEKYQILEEAQEAGKGGGEERTKGKVCDRVGEIKRWEQTILDHVGNQEIIHHEAQELENYRAAMQRMAEDIIHLRKDIAGLEADNSKLRSELSLHQDLGRTLLDDTDIDVMTKTEMADRIVLLKQKLTSETAEFLNCKDKVQQLQNELIRKNDRETELLRLQKVHQQQQAVLQKYQEKTHKLKILEDTIRQQEKVIEKMEKLLDKKLNERPREKPHASKKRAGVTDDNVRKEVESVLLAENARLRDEIEKLRNQPPAPIILQHPVHAVKESFSNSEKLNLLATLEKAQTRVQTLETLMEDNSRKWGREKQDMLTRLSECEHGFSRTSTMVLHDFPLKNASDSLLTRNQYGMIDPLA
uniref:coiled-coil domain-containing protein 33 n=1 Tax=Pristiophorus japonicus TaxID=55135 RepID=UPI00398F8B7D